MTLSLQPQKPIATPQTATSIDRLLSRERAGKQYGTVVTTFCVERRRGEYSTVKTISCCRRDNNLMAGSGEEEGADAATPSAAVAAVSRRCCRPHPGSIPRTVAASLAGDVAVQPTSAWLQVFGGNDSSAGGGGVVSAAVTQLKTGRVGRYIMCEYRPNPTDPFFGGGGTSSRGTEYAVTNLLGGGGGGNSSSSSAVDRDGEDALLAVYARNALERMRGVAAATASTPPPTVLVLGISLARTKRNKGTSTTNKDGDRDDAETFRRVVDLFASMYRDAVFGPLKPGRTETETNK